MSENRRARQRRVGHTSSESSATMLALLDALSERAAAASHWQRQYEVLRAVWPFTHANDLAKGSIQSLNAFPPSYDGLNRRFMGWTLYEWMQAPAEMVTFFGMTEAVERWRREVDGDWKIFTVIENGEPKGFRIVKGSGGSGE